MASSTDTLAAAINTASWVGILTAAAVLLLSLLMRRGPFGTPIATLGILTGALGIPSEAFRPLIGPLYLLHGLALPLWFALTGVAL